MTLEELRIVALEWFDRVGGETWPAKLELGLMAIAIGASALAIACFVGVLVRGE